MTIRNFGFDEMLSQFLVMRKMGLLKTIMRMIPGMMAIIPEEALEGIDERRIDRAEAIIRAMTPSERRNPDLLDLSRISRIANSSWTSLREVSDLLGQLYAVRRTLRGER